MRSSRGEGEFTSAGHWGASSAYDERLRESRGATPDVRRTTRVREVTRSVRLRFTTSTRVATRVYESREFFEILSLCSKSEGKTCLCVFIVTKYRVL